jgi:hypothetical protein
MRHPNKSWPTRLGLYTQQIVKPVFKVRGLMEGKIITHWPQLVGEKFARLAIPEQITFPKGKKTEGTLHLSVTSAGALLLQFSQDLILEQINTFFGYKALTKLRMTHGFIPPQMGSVKTPLPPSQGAQEWITAQIAHISDPELKERLEQLGFALSSSPSLK